MNPKFSFLLLVMAAAGIVTGCSKQREEPTAEKNLIGTWEWESTDGGIAFHIHETPATTGKNIDLKIAPGGTYAMFTNGALISNGTYVLEKRKCIHDHTDKLFVNLSQDKDFMVEKIDKANLDVSDEAYDGMGSRYKRKSYSSD